MSYQNTEYTYNKTDVLLRVTSSKTFHENNISQNRQFLSQLQAYKYVTVYVGSVTIVALLLVLGVFISMISDKSVNTVVYHNREISGDCAGGVSYCTNSNVTCVCLDFASDDITSTISDIRILWITLATIVTIVVGLIYAFTVNISKTKKEISRSAVIINHLDNYIGELTSSTEPVL